MTKTVMMMRMNHDEGCDGGDGDGVGVGGDGHDDNHNNMVVMMMIITQPGFLLHFASTTAAPVACRKPPRAHRVAT